VDKLQDKDDADFQKSSVIRCTVCNRDISKLSTDKREQHVNSCIDKQIDKSKKQTKVTNNLTTQRPSPTIVEEHIILGKLYGSNPLTVRSWTGKRYR
jgi:hypothetical protein